ncbi:MAG: hypothetical protein HZA18_07165 [Nitrospirae bacterium]|nr:hypothetical protein [Nitrospirota bacterium]
MPDFITLVYRVSIGKEMVSGFHRCKYANLAVMVNRIFAILLALSFLLPSLVLGEPPKNVELRATESRVIILEDKAYFDALLDKINRARSNILISMYLFKTTGRKESPANKIKEALIKAVKRGVHVKVLLEVESGRSSSLNKENRYTADGLIKGGVKVSFDSPGKRTHTKAIVVDNRYTFIGSHNLTSSALGYNNELSLMIDSADVAGETTRYIEEIIAKSFIKRP